MYTQDSLPIVYNVNGVPHALRFLPDPCIYCAGPVSHLGRTFVARELFTGAGHTECPLNG